MPNEKRRRVGIDGHVLTGKYQGSRTWLVNVVAGAARHDRCVDYIVYSNAPDEARRLVDAPNITHRRLPVRNPFLRLCLYWPYAILAHRLDFLVTQYFSPLVMTSRHVVVVHDVLFETHPHFFPPMMRWRNRLLVRLSATRARAVATVSSFSRKAMAAAYGLSEKRIALVRNGIRHMRPAPQLPAVVTRRYILFVGRLEPRKNLSLLLDAFADLRDDTLRLVVVGRPDFEASAVLDRLARTPRVIHLLDVDDIALQALYRDAAVLVFPSLGEGWGIPVLEALAAGTPVIASNKTAIPEAGGDVVAYFDPASNDARGTLARLIEEVMAGGLTRDPARLRAHVRRFRWENSGAAFAELIESL